MKNFITIILILFGTASFAQNTAEPIIIKKGLSTTYLLNGKPLKPKELLAITSTNNRANKYMLKANKNVVPATIFGSAGGFLIGYPLGSAIAGGKPNWSLMGIGAGLYAISIPFSIGFNKNTKAAVEIYNDDLFKSSSLYKSFKIESFVGNTGVGLKVTF